MKSFFQKMRKEEGFTLVELMVVVAIIGLLSAVAVPNFKKYQAKSKVSEAKLQLSAAYTAQQAFFSDYNIYHNCLAYMGFDPYAEWANRYYAIGIDQAAAINGSATTGAYGAAVNSGLNSTGCPINNAVTAGSIVASTASVPQATWFAAGKGIGSSIASTVNFLTGTSLGDQSTQANMTFVIGAAGVISADFVTNANSSALTINQAKVISNVRNGY